MRGYKYRQRLHMLGMAPAWGEGTKWPRRATWPLSVFALKVVKGLKEAVLDAGMRITGENNVRPRKRKRTEAHHGTEAKATGKEIACSSRAKKEKKKKELSGWDAGTSLHVRSAELLLTSLPLTGRQWLEKRGETSRTTSYTSTPHHHYVLRTVCGFNVAPPSVKYEQEPEAVMSGSCVECERTAAMWRKKGAGM